MPIVLSDLDFETYSEAGYVWNDELNKWDSIVSSPPHGLSAVGTPAYAEHPSTELLSLAYDLKDGLGSRLWLPGCPPPVDLFEHIAAHGLLEAWNSSFEFYIWHYVCHLKMGWPPLPLAQTRDAMAKARKWGLPGKLEKCAQAIDAPEQKDAAGHKIMMKLSKPRKPTIKNPDRRWTPQNAPEDFAKLYSYNAQDIKAEFAVSQKVPDLSPTELEIWQMDQRINVRGVQVDEKALDDCIAVVRQAENRYLAELRQITGGVVQTAGQGAVIIAWMSANGFTTTSIDADHVEAALKRTDLTAPVRRVLEIRQILGLASVKKLFALTRMKNTDGRMRDLFAYHGAGPGRWAGRGPQPQNLPKAGPKVVRCPHCTRVHWAAYPNHECPVCRGVELAPTAVAWGIEATESALITLATRDLDTVEKYWGDALSCISGVLRGLFVAAAGKDLICSDYSAIEAVVAAMISGEQWRIDVFRTHGKIYEASASTITGTPFEEMMAHKARTGQHHPDRNKMGKYAELASGFGGWIGAWKKFGADEYMTDDQIKEAILKWRAASPMIVEMWGGQWRQPNPDVWQFVPERYGLEGMAVNAIENPGQKFTYRCITYQVRDDVLYALLPSGRELAYHEPQLNLQRDPRGNLVQAISYMGYNSDYTKGAIGWMRIDTYSGKLFENVVQAIARDILAFAMVNLEKAGYPIVLHIHDEAVAEILKAFGSIEEFERIMGGLPQWAWDWPVKATGGWRGQRYRKD